MAKRRKKQSGKPAPSSLQKRSTPSEFHVVEYEITSEPVREKNFAALPEDVRKEIQRLHHLAQQKPRAAIPELHALLEQYPDVPALYNYLVVAYSHIGDKEKAEAANQENLRRSPDYLFARVNHAEMCLGRGEYDKVAEIFDHKFELSLLYPKRKRFHVSEVVAFYGVLGQYFWMTGLPEQAAICCDLLQQIDPGHPLARRLKANVRPSLWSGLMSRL